MLKEKIFNFLAKNLFGLNYSYSEAKTYSQNKEKENKSVNVNNINSFKNKENFKNGSLYASGVLNILKKEGDWDYYFRDTNILYKRIFHRNENFYEKEEFYCTGELLKKNIRTKLKENITEKYYKSGEIESIKIFLNYFETDLEDYFEYTFYINGTLKEKKRVQNGKLVGLYEKYREDGLLKKRFFSLMNGNLEGVYEEFYDNGLIKERTDYKNGKKEGFQKFYYKNNQVKEIRLFLRDRLVQILVEYDEKGNSLN